MQLKMVKIIYLTNHISYTSTPIQLISSLLLLNPTPLELPGLSGSLSLAPSDLISVIAVATLRKGRGGGAISPLRLVFGLPDVVGRRSGGLRPTVLLRPSAGLRSEFLSLLSPDCIILSISRYRLEFDRSVRNSRLGTSGTSGLIRRPIEVLTPVDIVAAMDFLVDEDVEPVADRCKPLGDDLAASSSREEIEAPRSR